MSFATISRHGARVLTRSSLQQPVRAFTVVKLSPRSSTLEDALALIHDHKVMIYSKSYCPFCSRAARDLDMAVGNETTVHKTELDNAGVLGQQVQHALAAKYGQTTVPAVFVDGKLIGGSSDVVAGLEDGSLIEALEAAGVLAVDARQ